MCVQKLEVCPKIKCPKIWKVCPKHEKKFPKNQIFHKSGLTPQHLNHLPFSYLKMIVSTFLHAVYGCWHPGGGVSMDLLSSSSSSSTCLTVSLLRVLNFFLSSPRTKPKFLVADLHVWDKPSSKTLSYLFLRNPLGQNATCMSWFNTFPRNCVPPPTTFTWIILS